VAVVTSFAAWGEILLMRGNPDGRQFVEKYQDSYFMGIGYVKEFSEAGRESGAGTTAKFVIVETLKGPEPGTELNITIPDDLLRTINIGARILVTVCKSMVLWEIYSDKNWAIVKERVELIKHGLYPPPKPEISEELKAEYSNRTERWMWAYHRYHHRKEMSKEEFEAQDSEYQEWLQENPEVKEYFTDTIE
jgi:hypothetical protein